MTKQQVNPYFSTLIIVAVVLGCTVTATAQWVIQADSSYGTSGVSLDATATRPSSSTYPERVFITSDGSSYTVRGAITPDTNVLVGRVMRNGQFDPLYDLDGMMAIGTSTNTSSFLLSPSELIWVGGGRAGRSEFTEIDRFGRIRSTPFWQDTALYTSNRVFGVRKDETLVMFSNRWNDPGSPTFIRYLVPGGVMPKSDVFVPFDPTTVDMTLESAIMDTLGRLYTGKQVTERSFAIARYTETGVVDANFGNAMGLLVMETPYDARPRITDVLRLRNGGYVIVLVINERVGNGFEPFVRLLKMDENGTLISSFGNNGVLDIRGSQMESRGIVECPNGDLLFASFGTYAYSHLYQIRPNGTFIPRQYGDFEIMIAVQLIRLTDDGLLYALSGDSTYKHYVVSRFRVDAVTSVNERDNPSPLDITIDHGVVSVKGASSSVKIRMYSLVGQCVFEQRCEPHGTVVLPAALSGTYVISASTDQDMKNVVVHVVR